MTLYHAPHLFHKYLGRRLSESLFRSSFPPNRRPIAWHEPRITRCVAVMPASTHFVALSARVTFHLAIYQPSPISATVYAPTVCSMLRPEGYTRALTPRYFAGIHPLRRLSLYLVLKTSENACLYPNSFHSAAIPTSARFAPHASQNLLSYPLTATRTCPIPQSTTITTSTNL